MFATCLFCNNALGHNDALEEFPVGRRLAFDAAKGRLWVICTACTRWNLSPLETRWEAIEAAERAFRDSRLRVSTPNIGLARLREGLELVRIGAPDRPEFAAWRYGTQFAKRNRKGMFYAIGFLGMSVLPTVSNALISIGGMRMMLVPTGGVMALSLGFSATSRYLVWKRKNQPKFSVRDNDGQLLRMTRDNVSRTTLFPSADGEWQLTVPHVDVKAATSWHRHLGNRQVAGDEHRPAMITGAPAHRALATLLPSINETGGNRKTVNDAVEMLTDAPDFGRALRHGVGLKGDSNKYFRLTTAQTYIGLFPGHVRLALEMSLHEEDERRAMQGELHELEARWRDADAIAKIADEMFLPTHIEDDISLLKQRQGKA